MITEMLDRRFRMNFMRMATITVAIMITIEIVLTANTGTLHAIAAATTHTDAVERSLVFILLPHMMTSNRGVFIHRR